MVLSPDSGAAPIPTPRTRLARIGAWVPCLAVALLVWMDQAGLPLAIAVDGPDGGSFQSALEHFFHVDARAGVDWVFTYGPLGLLENLSYDRDTFFGRLVLGDLLWRGLSAILVTLALWRQPSLLLRAVGVAALLLLPIELNSYLSLTLLAATELCLDRPLSSARAAAALAVVVPASLSKFTSFLLGIPLLSLIALVRARAVSRRAGIVFAACVLLAWLAAWLAAGQSLAHAPEFVWNSMRMASAYGVAMATACPEPLQTWALLAVLGAGLLLLLPWIGPLRASWRAGALDWVVIGRLAARAAVLATIAKSGLVRGGDHTPILFSFVAVAGFFAIDPAHLAGAARAGLALLRAALLVLSTACIVEVNGLAENLFARLGFLTGAQVDAVVAVARDPWARRDALDQTMVQARARRALPRTREVVGREPIDIQPPFPDTLLWNELAWRPRPVFISYAALSAEFEDWNRAFFEGAHAPRWFLVNPQPIDGRLPTMEDAGMQQVLARDYLPVIEEQGYLLVRRVDAPRPAPTPEIVLDRDVRFGDALDLAALPGDVHLLQIEAPPTAWGRARSLLLRPAEIQARIRGADGRESVVRLVPSMLARGAIVDPILASTADWMRWYEGRAERARSIEFLPPRPAWALEESLRVRVLAIALRPANVETDLERRLRYPMFQTLPASYEAGRPPEIRDLSGTSVLVVDTPSALRFRVGPGVHRVTGALGVLPESIDPGQSDGVSFQALVQDPETGERPIAQRFVDPRVRPAEGGILTLRFQFEVDRECDLLLRTLPGPHGNATDDRGFWTAIQID